VRKYDANNQLLWADTYAGSDALLSNLDEGWGVAIDDEGNIAVAGFTDTLDDAYDLWLRTYASDGQPGWTAIFANPDQLSEHGRAVGFGPDGSVVVSGTQWTVGEPNHRNVWLRKYSDAGQVMWTQTHDGGELDDDESWGLAIDADGSVMVVGYTTLAGDQQILARRYAP